MSSQTTIRDACCRRMGLRRLVAGIALLAIAIAVFLGLYHSRQLTLTLDEDVTQKLALLCALPLAVGGAWLALAGLRVLSAARHPVCRTVTAADGRNGWLYLHRAKRGRGSLHLGISGLRPLVLVDRFDRLEDVVAEITHALLEIRRVEWNVGAFIDAIDQNGRHYRSAAVMTVPLAVGLLFFAWLEDDTGLAMFLAFFAVVFGMAGLLALQHVLRGLNPLATTGVRLLIESPDEVVGVEAAEHALHVRTTQGERESIRVLEPLPLRHVALSVVTDAQYEWNDVLEVRFRADPASVRPSAMSQPSEPPPQALHAGQPLERFRWLRIESYLIYLLAVGLLASPALDPYEVIFWLSPIVSFGFARSAWRRARLTPSSITICENGLQLPKERFIPWAQISRVERHGSRWRVVGGGRPLIVGRSRLLNAIVERAGLRWLGPTIATR